MWRVKRFSALIINMLFNFINNLYQYDEMLIAIILPGARLDQSALIKPLIMCAGDPTTELISFCKWQGFPFQRKDKALKSSEHTRDWKCTGVQTHDLLLFLLWIRRNFQIKFRLALKVNSCDFAINFPVTWVVIEISITLSTDVVASDIDHQMWFKNQISFVFGVQTSHV